MRLCNFTATNVSICQTWHVSLIGVLPEQTWARLMWRFVCVLLHIYRHTMRFPTFPSPLGAAGPPNLCPRELTLFSPPELCLGAGHLAGATGEMPPRPSPNPTQSIEAGMAAGLSSARVPQGELLISINVKWCCPRSNTRATHALLYTHTHTWAATRTCARDGELVLTLGKIWRSEAVM